MILSLAAFFGCSVLVYFVIAWAHGTPASSINRKEPDPGQVGILQVPATPLSGHFRRNVLPNFSLRSLTALDPDRLAFRFDAKAKIGGIVSLVAGAFLLSPLTAFSSFEERAQAGAILLVFHGFGGLAFTLSGLYILLNFGAVCFDRAQGQMIIRGIFGRRQLDLERIKAVQLVSGGRHLSDGEEYESFQVNLVLDDPAEPRRNLLDHHELEEMRKSACELAGFLQVPLIAQVDQNSSK
ncbi:MAG: hypothetical protein HY040_28860 [Planctomycetes bacterium]|nr:hypothetical protein [Planctomycetota bacterium]